MGGSRSFTLTRHCERGTYLFRQGDRCEGVFVLLRGKVAVSTELEHRNIRISYAANGAILGLAENLGGHSYQTTAVAVTSVTVHFIPKEDLVSMIQDEPATGMQVLELLSNDLTTVYSLAKRLPERRRGIRLRREKRQSN